VPLDHFLAMHEFLPADVHRMVGDRLERIDIVEIYASRSLTAGSMSRARRDRCKRGAILALSHERLQRCGVRT
jgi:hypothetical protein